MQATRLHNHIRKKLGILQKFQEAEKKKSLQTHAHDPFQEAISVQISPTSRAQCGRTKHPQKHPHFHEKIHTTGLQPERSLSRNLKKFPSHKYLNHSTLEKSRNSHTDSMDVAGWLLVVGFIFHKFFLDGKAANLV